MSGVSKSAEVERLIPLIMRLQRIFLVDLNRRTNQGNISISQFMLLSILNQGGAAEDVGFIEADASFVVGDDGACGSADSDGPGEAVCGWGGSAVGEDSIDG
jgi:hypothetical protein